MKQLEAVIAAANAFLAIAVPIFAIINAAIAILTVVTIKLYVF